MFNHRLHLMRIRLVVILFVILAPGLAAGGPWLREARTGFASTSALRDGTGAFSGSVYLEYGLWPKTTLVTKLENTNSITGARETEARVFARRAIRKSEGPMLYAYEIGAGIADGQGLVHSGLTLGRGIKMGEKYGWAVLDTTLDLKASPRLKLEATLGLTLSQHWKVMFQVFATHEDQKTSLTYAPSLIWSPKAGPTSIQFGLEQSEAVTGLHLGLWRTF
jgi:hypothetical protein